MRLFFALPLPADVIRELARVQRTLKDTLSRGRVAWVDPKNFHVTLHFLGDVEHARANALIEALDALAPCAPFNLSLQAVSAFPHSHNPKILQAVVSPHPKLLEVRRDLLRLLTRLEIADDPKPFRPHITLGRVRAIATIPNVRRVPIEPIAFPVERFDLVQSMLTPHGSDYLPCKEIRLTA